MKQTIDITFENGSNGFALQNEVSEVIHEKLLPGMERLFDEFGNDSIFSFDTLNVDCGILAAKHWGEQWVSETLRGLREQLLAAQPSRTDIGVSKRVKLQNIFLFYIEHAYLPWNANVVSIQALEGVEIDDGLIERLQQLIEVDANTINRLVITFSEPFIHKVVQHLADRKNVDMSTLMVSDKEEPSEKRRRIKQGEIIDALCRDQVRLTERQGDYAQKNRFKNSQASLSESGIYISNAGLVILHPFLQPLFEACDLIKGSHWIDGAVSQGTALMTLQFLVWGKDDGVDLNPVLSRILCAHPIEEEIVIEKGLPDATKQECETLLHDVITHWKVLKSTGGDALRETFLQRNGKLTQAEGGWLLQVEQKSYDVLMGALPWGVGTIKLPWMKEILYVEWV